MENLNEDYTIDMELERRIIGRIFFDNDGNWIPMLSENRKYFKGNERNNMKCTLNRIGNYKIENIMRKYGVPKKSAEKWAEKVLEDYKQTEEYKREKEEMDREFKDFILYGKSTTWFNDDTLKDILEYDGVIKIEKLSVSEIVERFGDLLSEEDLKKIKKTQWALKIQMLEIQLNKL